jgi:hypothetical protein
MHLAGTMNWLVSSAIAAALTVLVAGSASAWVITEPETLRAKARSGEGLVYPPSSPGHRPGVFVLHEAEGLCVVDAAASDGATGDAVQCQTIQSANGQMRGRITVDVNREIGVTGVVASELARAIDAINPRNGDRLASLKATSILPSMPFQPPDTGGTEWTGVAFGIDGPVDLRGPAPAPSDPWKLFKKLVKSMLLPAIAVVVTIALLVVGLRRLRHAHAHMT